MKQFFGKSKSGNLKEAVQGLNQPKLILLMSNKKQFEAHVKELEELYPNVPSIGCIGMAYDTAVVENGVGIVGFYDRVEATANVLEKVSVMPARYIQRIEKDLQTLKASSSNTFCIDFCAGNDACVLTTIYSVFEQRNIDLVGGTGDSGKVSANGVIYEDAAVYALIKNLSGKVKAYKENIYRPMEGFRFIASKTDRSKYLLGELNGKSAKKVYEDALHVSEKDIGQQTFKNPFGRRNGKDICIISINKVVDNSLVLYRQVNDSDVLVLLELRDYKKIVRETIDEIKRDFTHVSGVFSVNCVFRYLLFSQENYMQEYLKEMSKLGTHTGLIGYGEHYKNQFVNQSMVCIAFE